MGKNNTNENRHPGGCILSPLTAQNFLHQPLRATCSGLAVLFNFILSLPFQTLSKLSQLTHFLKTTLLITYTWIHHCCVILTSQTPVLYHIRKSWLCLNDTLFSVPCVISQGTKMRYFPVKIILKQLLSLSTRVNIIKQTWGRKLERLANQQKELLNSDRENLFHWYH